jgi:predicted Rossmann fold flavoprotein
LENFDLIIIGGGAAGLFAAAHSKDKTLVLEKKANVGNKLLIAGQGRCNFTHSGPISDFILHYGANGKFVKHFLKQYTNKDLIKFFVENGLQITEDKNGKLFPKSGNAQDILNILLKQCKKNGITFHLNKAVTVISFSNGLFHLLTKEKEYQCRKIIIATGGLSYPSTGSSGDGYHLAKLFGHSIVATRPSLSPVYIKNYLFKELAGVSLKNCQLNLYRESRKIDSHCGDIGFTHKGLSGPGILDFSRNMQINDIIMLNICGTSTDEFNRLFLDEVKTNGKSTIQVFMKQFDLPKGLFRLLLSELSIQPADKIGNINKDQRKALIEKFCANPFEIEKIGDYNIAMATAGGVALSEVNPKTMESKLRAGLFFAGEVLDIDGDTGGYNLQAAFSTGYCAAIS